VTCRINSKRVGLLAKNVISSHRTRPTPCLILTLMLHAWMVGTCAVPWMGSLTKRRHSCPYPTRFGGSSSQWCVVIFPVPFSVTLFCTASHAHCTAHCIVCALHIHFMITIPDHRGLRRRVSHHTAGSAHRCANYAYWNPLFGSPNYGHWSKFRGSVWNWL
jgi:hypothetical protein